MKKRKNENQKKQPAGNLIWLTPKKTKVLVEWSMSNPPKIEKKNENQEK